MLPADCATLGGTVGEGGVCSISGLKLSSINDSWDIASEQTVVISGSDTLTSSHGISVGADNGGTFQVNVADNASLTIRGGTNSSYGISVGAKDGTLQLVNAGSLLIKGGASYAHGIATGTQGGTFILSNGSSGVVRIEGSDSSDADGILTGVRDGLFTLSNAAGGRIEISGGGAKFAYGIGSLARGETAKAVVENDGCILWQGSAEGAPGMVQFSSDGAETVVTNGSRGELVIKGSDTSNASGVFYWTYRAGSRVSIDNRGIFRILGGAGAKGMLIAVPDGGSATVVNRGGAEMTIAGGSESYVSGIGTFSAQWGSEGTSTAEIINEAGAVLNISGGTAAGACGITYGAESGGASFSLLNQEGALLKLTGNTAQAINRLNNSPNSSASIINSGTAVLNANAIYRFYAANADGTKSFTNKAAGTLRAEVGALFTGATVTKTEQTKMITFGMMNADGIKTTASREVTGYDYSVTGSSIAIKSDWLNLAEFEAGSTVVFTDVLEGTAAADKILLKFREAHGSDVNVVFTKVFADRGIDLASVRTLVNAYPGKIFYDTDVSAEGDIFKITGSTGFRSILGATNVIVGDGADLTLLGDGATVSDTFVSVKSGGTLHLGTSVGNLEDTGGSLSSVQNAGTMKVIGEYEAGTLRNTGSVLAGIGSVMELKGRGSAASDIGSYANRGILRISGETKSGRVTQNGGRFEVTAAGIAHLDLLEGSGVFENKGLLIADVGSISGSVYNEGLIAFDSYVGGITSTFTATEGSIVIAESFNPLGVVRVSGATLVIGADAKEQYLLEHLDQARRFVDVGATVSESVLAALEAAGETEAVMFYRLRREAIAAGEDDTGLMTPEEADEARRAADDLSYLPDSSGLAASTMAEAALLSRSDTQDVRFLRTVLLDGSLTTENRARIINSVMQIGSAAGTTASLLADASALSSGIEERVSRLNHEGTGLWVRAEGGKTRQDGLKLEGIGRAGYDTTVYGFTFGADSAVRNDFLLGAAFSYLRGSAEAKGGTLDTKNDYDTFGLQGYAVWSPSEYGRLIGNVGFFRTSGEVTQSIGLSDFSRATADPDATAVTLGVRFEGLIDGFGFRMVPYIGLRSVWIHSDDFTARIDGRDAFRNDQDDTFTVQMPVGVALDKAIDTASGWKIVPNADLTVTPQFGDTKALIRVTGVGSRDSERLNSDIAGNVIVRTAFGVRAVKGGAEILAKYAYTGGDAGRRDHMFTIGADYRF